MLPQPHAKTKRNCANASGRATGELTQCHEFSPSLAQKRRNLIRNVQPCMSSLILPDKQIGPLDNLGKCRESTNDELSGRPLHIRVRNPSLPLARKGTPFRLRSSNEPKLPHVIDVTNPTNWDLYVLLDDDIVDILVKSYTWGNPNRDHVPQFLHESHTGGICS
jgi:hypothetical protein